MILTELSCLDALKNTNRVVVTVKGPFDARKRKKYPALADFRVLNDIKVLFHLLEFDGDEIPKNWMSPISCHLNFMLDKQVIASIGLVDDFAIRVNGLGDYTLINEERVMPWLVEQDCEVNKA